MIECFHLCDNSRLSGVVAYLFFVSTLILPGCGNGEKIASNKNFLAAINSHYTKSYNSGMYCMGPTEYPVKSDYYVIEESLVKFGFIEKVGKNKDFSGERYIFDLTSIGREYYQLNKGFCFGKLEASRVLQFSEPATSSLGSIISSVTVEVISESVPAWAAELLPVIESDPRSGNLKITSIIAKVINSKEQPTVSKETLILTGAKWVHESDL